MITLFSILISLPMIEQNLISLLKDTFKLDLHGIHGCSHWARVRINGLKISQSNGANKRVVELFAFLHDSKRQNDHYDPEHGLRASEFIQTLSNDFLKIDDSEKDLLTFACEHHTNSKGIITDDITIHTCWDADRLDLGRVGVMPVAERLNTTIGKDADFIKQTYNRSIYSNKITIRELLNKLWR